MTALTILEYFLKNFSNTAPNSAQSSVQRKPVTESMKQLELKIIMRLLIYSKELMLSYIFLITLMKELKKWVMLSKLGILSKLKLLKLMIKVKLMFLERRFYQSL